MNKLLLTLIAVFMAYALPAEAAVYALDPAHTVVGFSIEHMVISNVNGVFGDFKGEFEVDGSNKLSNASTVINAGSIDTRIEKRDDHLRGPDFFDTAKYPEMSFKAVSVKQNGGKAFTLEGDFTMHGVTRRVSLEGEIRGPIKDPWGSTRAGIIVQGQINRKDFGLTWNNLLESGGLVVGELVDIKIEGEGILKQ